MKHYLPEHSEERNGLADSGTSALVSVAELLEQAMREGRGVRLHWTEADTDPYGLAAVPPDDEWPTVVLPRVQEGLGRWTSD